MKYVIVLLMLSSFLSACHRKLNQATGKPKQTGNTTIPTRHTQPAGEEMSLIKSAGIKRYFLHVDGDKRTFLVQLPVGYSPSKTYPIIFFFHSIRGRDTSWIKNRGANVYIDKHQYIAIYAQGANGGIWNVGGNYPFKNVSEPHYVQAMYNWLKSNINFDTRKVYAVGTSNGAILIHYLAVQLNLFTAVATISGSLYTNEMNASAKPVAVLQIHGTVDKTVPYDGGYNPWGYTFLSAQNTAREWAKVNGCNAEPAVNNLLNNQVISYTYNNCKTGKPVVLYALANVPHKVLQSFDAAWIYNRIFDFFEKN